MLLTKQSVGKTTTISVTNSSVREWGVKTLPLTGRVIEKIATIPITETNTLDKTDRGDSGFGSTGTT